MTTSDRGVEVRAISFWAALLDPESAAMHDTVPNPKQTFRSKAAIGEFLDHELDIVIQNAALLPFTTPSHESRYFPCARKQDVVLREASIGGHVGLKACRRENVFVVRGGRQLHSGARSSMADI